MSNSAESLISSLVYSFDEEVRREELRAAAETAFALANIYRDNDVNGGRDWAAAKTWASRSIDLLRALPSSSVADVASTRQYVGGIAVPDLLHEGVVRERLLDVLVL